MKAIIEMFIRAREIQFAGYRQTAQMSEEIRQSILARQQRAEDIMELTAKFGGDFGKAATEYDSAKGQIFVIGHRRQQGSEYFRAREEALVKLGQQKDGNPVLETLFEELFLETAVEAINRNYSNGRSFFFMAPFIGGIIMNKTNIPWERGTVEEIHSAIVVEQERMSDFRVVLKSLECYNAEAESIKGRLAASMWATFDCDRDIFDLVKRFAALATPGVPNTPSYSSFWREVHSGSADAAAILRVFKKHEADLKASLGGYLRKWKPKVPEWAAQPVQMVLS